MIEFTKMSGAGNDFIVFDNRGREFKGGDMAEVVRRLCMRALSVGADGVILADKARGADLRMSYWNADGQRADFCANGTRCAVRFAQLKGFARGPEIKVATDGGVVACRALEDGQVAIPIPGRFSMILRCPIHVDALSLEGSYAMAGVPHYVLPVKNLWTSRIEELGRKIRNHPKFQPDGINVNFVTVKTDKIIQIRTYERGPERETLSCGSGCVASALVLAATGTVSSPVVVQTRSGIDLEVAWRQNGVEFDEIILTGDARVIFQGFIEVDATSGFKPELREA